MNKAKWISGGQLVNCQLLERIVYTTALIYLFIAVASGYAYNTTNNMRLGGQVTVTTPETNPTDLKACENDCRLDEECQAFVYDQANFICSHKSNALGYGPLAHSDRTVVGELDSKSPNASLVWLGFGDMRGMSLQTVSKTPMTHEQCQTICDESKEVVGEECIAYEIDTNWEPDRCTTYVSYFVETTQVQSGYHIGVRADIKLSKTEIIGDPFDTRVYPDDIPAAPPDIGTAVPEFTESDLNYQAGLFEWGTLARVEGTTTWQECSVECHRNDQCDSFMSWRDTDANKTKCDLYSAAILGRMKRGYAKYGVIDRSGVEGAVSSLVNADKTISGNVLQSVAAADFEDCAKLCYNLYEPQQCFAFHFEELFLMCYLYDALPCDTSYNESSFIMLDYRNYFYWDSEKYRFGYLEERIPQRLYPQMDACGMKNFTAEPTTTTTATEVPVMKKNYFRPCPDNPQGFEFGDHCYWIENISDTDLFENAAVSCGEGALLATPIHPEVRRLIIATMQEKTLTWLWTGLQQTGEKNGKVSDGWKIFDPYFGRNIPIESAFTPWTTGKPNDADSVENGSQDSVMMNDEGYFSDKSSDQTSSNAGAACQKKLYLTGRFISAGVGQRIISPITGQMHAHSVGKCARECYGSWACNAISYGYSNECYFHLLAKEDHENVTTVDAPGFEILKRVP